MSLFDRCFHRDKKKPIHPNCPKKGETEQCDPFHDDPRALPSPRPRQLSISPAPVPHNHKPSIWPSKSRPSRRLPKPASDQMQSSFFSRLPLELRKYCYTQVLCEPERTFHIFLCDSKFTYTSCRKPGQLDHHVCWLNVLDVYGNISYTGTFICYGGRTDAQIETAASKRTINLNMLMACRRIYVAAIDVLYAENTFSFNSGRRLNVFLTTILPHRFNAIRRLSFNWISIYWEGEPPYPIHNTVQGGSDEDHAWNTMCSRIAKMPHLRHLRCTLRIEDRFATRKPLQQRFNVQKERELLESLRQINRPESFEVVITWEPLINSTIKSEEFPFTITWMKGVVLLLV